MKSFFVATALVVFALSFETTNAYVHDCSVLYRSVGCYAENSEERALPDLMITDSNFSSSSYSGKRIDWFDYGVYLDHLDCRCAKKAQENGYTHFGLQSCGECWACAHARLTYSYHGKSKNCINEHFRGCEGPDGGDCIGVEDANFVYELIHL